MKRAFLKRKVIIAVIAAIIVISLGVTANAQSGSDIAGTVPRLLTAVSDKNSMCHECSLGNAVADAAKKYLNTDIAIISGGDLAGNLPPGDITWDELREIFREDRQLAVVTVDITQLSEILEAALWYIAINEEERIDVEKSVYEGFPQIAGFTLYYDVATYSGSRIYDIEYNGKRLDRTDKSITFTLAATEFMLSGGYGMPVIPNYSVTDWTLASVTAQYINDGMPEYVITTRRIHPMGAADDGIISHVPKEIIPFFLIIFVIAGLGRKKYKPRREL